MSSRFFGTSSALSSIRGRVPRYHSAELGGVTSILDALWIVPGQPPLQLVDAEGEASRRHAAIYRGSSGEAGFYSTPEADASLRVFEDRTSLHDVGGAELYRTELCTLAVNREAGGPGEDEARQILVARYAGKPADDLGLEGFLRYHVLSATGSWNTATDLFVSEAEAGPGGSELPARRLLIGRTPTSERVVTIRK